jgi:8-oxo-dGTP pyrophosphatase MutT (NUDIX family)
VGISPYLARLRRTVGSELLVVPSVTIIVFDEARRVLLVQHADVEAWVAPGGSIEPGESPADAVVREMREETDLLVEPLRVLGVYGGPEFRVTYRNGDQVEYVMTVFECRVVGGGEPRTDGVEAVRARYVAREELGEVELAEWAKIVLSQVFAHDGQAHFRPPNLPRANP